jgi:hypothetical protein
MGAWERGGVIGGIWKQMSVEFKAGSWSEIWELSQLSLHWTLSATNSERGDVEKFIFVIPIPEPRSSVGLCSSSCSRTRISVLDFGSKLTSWVTLAGGKERFLSLPWPEFLRWVYSYLTSVWRSWTEEGIARCNLVNIVSDSELILCQIYSRSEFLLAYARLEKGLLICWLNSPSNRHRIHFGQLGSQT